MIEWEKKTKGWYAYEQDTGKIIGEVFEFNENFNAHYNYTSLGSFINLAYAKKVIEKTFRDSIDQHKTK